MLSLTLVCSGCGTVPPPGGVALFLLVSNDLGYASMLFDPFEGMLLINGFC